MKLSTILNILSVIALIVFAIYFSDSRQKQNTQEYEVMDRYKKEKDSAYLSDIEVYFADHLLTASNSFNYVEKTDTTCQNINELLYGRDTNGFYQQTTEINKVRLPEFVPCTEKSFWKINLWKKPPLSS